MKRKCPVCGKEINSCLERKFGGVSILWICSCGWFTKETHSGLGVA